MRRPSHPRHLILIAEQEAGRLSERLEVGRIWQQDARALADLVDDPARRILAAQQR